MEKIESYIPKIILSLQEINPAKIILFGSLVTGNIHEDSDIDLVVILDKDDLPKSFDEKLKNKLLVRNAILELSYEVSIDILVYTKAEFKKLESIKSPFLNEITIKGSVLYEKAS